MAINSATIEKLIEMKYRIPLINERSITRPHLYTKLNSALKRKVTLVVAPAGYGKTTTVLQWIEECRVTATWLSLDKNDNNQLRFWKYAYAALDVIAPGIFTNEEYIFSSHDIFNSNIQINIIIDKIMKINNDFVFVIDDIHLIDNEEVINGLLYLIDYLPPKMHLILISRNYPHKLLSKHSIKSKVPILNATDLLFKDNEIFKFYEMHGYTIDYSKLQLIKKITEGWAVALVAMTTNGEEVQEGNKVISKLTQKTIEQYIVEEILNYWPKQKKIFALKTSVLETLSEEVCNEITGERASGKILDEMRQRTEFVICLDEEKITYRYHHLLKDTLYNLLRDEYAEEFLLAHNRAGDYFLRVGQATQAMEHYLKAKNYDAAYNILDKELLNYIVRFELTKSNIQEVPSINIATKGKDLKYKLTSKEKEVLRLILDALSNEEISLKLNISLRTVKAHTGNIYSKLGVKNRAQCVKFVNEANLLE